MSVVAGSNWLAGLADSCFDAKVGTKWAKRVVSRRLRGSWWRLVWLSAASSTLGCSFAMKPAPADPSLRTREAAEACTPSLSPLGLDLLGAGIGGVNMAVSASAAPGKVRWMGAVEMDHETGFVLGVTQLALHGAGAVYGFVQLARCSNLRAEFADDPEFEPEQRQKRAHDRSEREGQAGQRPPPRFGTAPSEPGEEQEGEGAPTDDDLFTYD